MSSLAVKNLLGLCTAADDRDVMHLDQAKGTVTAFADLAKAAGVAVEYQAHFSLQNLQADKEKLEELIWLKKQGSFSKIVVFAAGNDKLANYFNALFSPYDVSADDVMVVFTTAGSPASLIEGVWRPDVIGLSESCVSQQDRSALWDRGVQIIYFAGIPHNLTDQRLEEAAQAAWSKGTDLKVTSDTVMVVMSDCHESNRIPTQFVAKAARTPGAMDVVVMSEFGLWHGFSGNVPGSDVADKQDAALMAGYLKELRDSDDVASAEGFICRDDDNRLPAALFKIKRSGQARIVVSGLEETAVAILSSHCPHVTVTMHPAMNGLQHGAMTAMWRAGWIDVQDENGRVTPRETSYPGTKNVATKLVAQGVMRALKLAPR